LFYRGTKATTIHDLTPLRFNLAVGRVGRLLYPLKKELLGLMLRRAGKKSVAVFTGTHFVKQDLVENLSVQEANITVTSESADIIKDTPKAISELRGKAFIFYVGRAQAHKNIDGLILAFEKVLQTNPETILVLAGKKDAAYTYLEQLAQKKNINNILFTGFVSEAELHWLYKNCAAYVFPSLSEGFGLPGLEAMAHGCPVVSSNATCLPEVYGDAALYFNPENIEDIVHKIDRILRDTQLRKDLIERGKKQTTKYSWTGMAQKTLDVYTKIINT
jgi:glycosyltransferase involved in cell wall biosynthesis